MKKSYLLFIVPLAIFALAIPFLYSANVRAQTNTVGNLQFTPVNSGTTANLNAVTYGNSSFVAVGENSTVLISNPSASWTKANLPTDGLNLRSVTYGNGKPAGSWSRKLF